MNCPDPLLLDHAKILRYKPYKALIANFLSSQMKWGDDELKPVRDAIRSSIRKSQAQSCYYCRRNIPLERRNVGEAIEHFLDKSKPHYRKWAFHPLNLVIACQPCNMVKSTKELGNNAVKVASFLQPLIGEFKWPHPYFDSYTENVQKSPGPIFSAVPGSPRQRQAAAMITDLKLDSLANLDDRVQFAASELQNLQARLLRVARRRGRIISQDRYDAFLNEIETRLDRAMFEIFGI